MGGGGGGGGGLKRLFVCFDPNGVNVSKFVYVQTKTSFSERE